MKMRTSPIASDPTPAPPQILTEQACQAIVAQVKQMTKGIGFTRVIVSSNWWSEVRWARNRVSVVGESHQPNIVIRRYSLPSDGADFASAVTNQTDLTSLTAATKFAEKQWESSAQSSHSKLAKYTPPVLTYPKARFWSDATYAMTADERCVVANNLMAGAERAGMLSAGDLMVMGVSAQIFLKDDRMLYATLTLADCSITVRDPQGTGSGWAGGSSWDWSRINAHTLADVALDKCLRSRNPVRIEPGRYTLIMEPQATYGLMEWLMASPMSLTGESTRSETGQQPPFFDHVESAPPVSRWGPPVTMAITKIGKRVLDPRITITYEPDDPDMENFPFEVNTGDVWQPVTWFKDGVLTSLAYNAFLGPPGGLDPKGKPNSGLFRMTGGTTTIEEMIATTNRGLLTTRFAAMANENANDVLISGVTRDGLWLIENGKIVHPVNNLRFVESPLYAFNQVQQLGVPVPIYAPQAPVIAPPVKVSDFNFVALVDAV